MRFLGWTAGSRVVNSVRTESVRQDLECTREDRRHPPAALV